MQNFDAAISDFTRAVEINSKFAKAYNNRALCYEAWGETEKARADFEKAKESGYTESEED